ncbi:MAG: hypothetical protein EOO05_11080 [Chitinophagaceae bacterium]|nr:MAG: hypothetical protein EOO05_11080 [Chitinophagaceae bacterium]
MNGPLYYIRQYSDEVYEHGGVGYTDIEKILETHGYKMISLPDRGSVRAFTFFSRVRSLAGYILSLEAGSTVVFIHPVFARMYRLMIGLLAIKRIRIICILADIDGVKDGDDNLLRKELRFLKRCDAFVVHNSMMRKWLLERFPGARVSALGLFDFLVKPIGEDRIKTSTLVFAGNLAKSGFLVHLHAAGLEHLQFNLYGPGPAAGIAALVNVSYKGSFAPAALPMLLEGSFGLVWDGDSIAAPAGSLGHYMSLISQHKLSLYIVAGLPVIIHSSAACAGFIVDAGIGFAVDDLRSIPGKIKALPEESYRLMQYNMKPFAEKISHGANLLQALAELAG